RRPLRLDLAATGEGTQVGGAAHVRPRRNAVMIAETVERARAFSSLVKLSHTVFALPFAASAVVLSLGRPHLALTAGRAVAMLVAMVAARTAAMAYNRYLDREIDAKNPRTRQREVPRGVVSPGAALGLTIGSSFVFLAAAASLGKWP